MAAVEISTLRHFLEALGRDYAEPATLILLGGSALCLLGSPRPTVDIDYVGDDLHKDHFQQVVEEVAWGFQLEAEAVPIAQFVPMLLGAEERRLYVGRYGAIEVYILDPYTMALSKLDRGFDTDIEDIVYLARNKLIKMADLEALIRPALFFAREYDLSPSAIDRHLAEVYRQLESG